MGKESGKKVLLKIGDGADPEVFTSVKGQRDTRLSMQASPTDVSDKTSDGWGATIPGTKQATITVSGVAVWPDTAGWDVLREAFEDEAEINVHLVANTDGDGWKGPVTVTGFDYGGSHDGGQEYSITLQNSGPLVWVEAA